MADSEMSDASRTSKRTRTAAEGAEEVGQGLTVTVPRNIPHLYNNNYTVRLTYAESFNTVISPGSSDGFRIATNTIFDPNSTGTGHQPIMRDLWASQYDYYAVLAMHYKIWVTNCYNDAITFTAAGTSAQAPSQAVTTIMPSTNTTDYASMVNAGGVFPTMEMKNTRSFVTNKECPPLLIEGTLTPGDFIVDAKDADSDTTWTAVGSNPTVLRYLNVVHTHCLASALTGSSEVPYILMSAIVQLDYDVQFTQMNPSLRGVPS